MQPRTVKGPSWANEPQPQSQTPVRKVEKVNPEDNQMGVNPTPSQDVLSDLEWMKQRMAKSMVQDSETTTPRLDPLPLDMAGINQVRLRRRFILPCRLTQPQNSQKPRQAIQQETPFSKPPDSLSGTSPTPAQTRT